MLIACRYRAATCVALLLAALPLSGPSAAPSETAGKQIARGDQLYTQAKLGEAREAYRAALQAEQAESARRRFPMSHAPQ